MACPPSPATTPPAGSSATFPRRRKPRPRSRRRGTRTIPASRGGSVARAALGLFLAGVGRIHGRDAIALGGPFTEIDELAALRAERPPFRLDGPLNRRPAARARHNARRVQSLAYRLQNMSSNST